MISSRNARPIAFAALAGLIACSQPGAAAKDRRAQRPANPAKEKTMSSTACANDPLSRSVCMIRLVTDDVAKEFGGVDGGGISEIRAASSTSYTVSLPREERVQQLTYEFEVKDGSVTLARRSESTKSF